MPQHWSNTGQALVKRSARACAQWFGVTGGVAELEAMAEMKLWTETNIENPGEEKLRALRALLRRPLVAGRLVYLNLG